MKKTKLTTLIAPAFRTVARDIKRNRHREYWLKGGRGSTKSSFVSIMIIVGMMRDKNANAVCIKKVKATLRESVFEQLLWAIEMLGVQEYWQVRSNPLALTYTPTGQKIVFRGLDDPKKVRSSKLARGYFKFIWFEELDEFESMEEIRMVNQTFLRGGDKFCVLYSYNPPRSQSNWVNVEAQTIKPSRRYHTSTYKDVPIKWLGEPFIEEAEHLKKTNLNAYRHEYMGETVGYGGEVFGNVSVQKITQKTIDNFTNIRLAIDWGYAVDPFAFCAVHYDTKRRKIYIFEEIYAVGLSNRDATERIQALPYHEEWICADSSEPKSIDQLRALGLRVRGAKKGPGSVKTGIKWLASRTDIIIDPERCPAAAREFVGYELERSRSGEFVARYPDKNNHMIDAVRYALEVDMQTTYGGFTTLR